MRFWLLWFAALLGACVSTEMRGYVGRDINEVFMAYGSPENVLSLPDGTRAFQFRQGRGAYVAPGQATTTVRSVGNTAVATTTATPAMLVQTDGCLLTFIARPQGNSWIVSDIRVPRQMVC